jgi:endoglucanase
MITDFGGANGTECDSYLTGIVDYMADNSVYIGWSIWAAGPLWGSYSAYCANYGQWGSLEPGSVAADGSPGMYETVWLQEIEPLLPTTLQQTGMSSVNGGASVGGGGGVGSGSSSSSAAGTTRTTSSTTSTTSTTSVVPLYGQCGGIGYTGSTVCASGTCTYYSPYCSQCFL